MYVYIYIYIVMYIYIYIHISLSLYIYIHTHPGHRRLLAQLLELDLVLDQLRHEVGVQKHLGNINNKIYIYIYIYIYVWVIYVYTYIYIYIHIYIYIYIWVGRKRHQDQDLDHHDLGKTSFLAETGDRPFGTTCPGLLYHFDTCLLWLASGTSKQPHLN